MGVPQYLRKASLLIGADTKGLDLSALRLRFMTRRGNIQTPNSCEVRVYNVSNETAQKAQKEFTRLVLQAGYDGNFGLIFDGTIKQVRRGRENPTDTYLDITAADGDSAYNFAFINQSLAAGSKPSDHVGAAKTAMTAHGISAGYLPDLGGNPLPRGKVMYGLAREYLRDTARTAQADWSIQDGKLQIVPQTAYVPGDIPEINAASGMVGLPEQTENGIKVKMLLNPNIKIGQLIKLNNASIQRYEYSLNATQGQVQNEFVQTYSALNNDGMYKVMIAEHTGDTRGDEWYTEVICLSADLTTSPGLLNRSVAAPAGPVKPFG